MASIGLAVHGVVVDKSMAVCNSSDDLQIRLCEDGGGYLDFRGELLGE